MRLIRLSDGKYPYTLYDLQQEFPNTSFPRELSEIDLSKYGAALLVQLPEPEYDSTTQYLTRNPPELVEDQWVEGWTINEIPPSADWDSFNFALFTDTNFINYGILVTGVNPYLIPAIVERYAQIAKVGLLQSGFTNYWNVFCLTAGVSIEHRLNWFNLAETHNLPLKFKNLIKGDEV